MGLLSSYRRRPEVKTLSGLKCPACGGGIYLSPA
jgi:hypothetical protein